MVTCKRCHSENFGDTRFCTFCGSRLPLFMPPAPRWAATSAQENGAGETSRFSPAGGASATRRNAAKEAARLAHDDYARQIQKRVYAHFMAAKEAISRRDFPRAISQFKAALEVNPGDTMIAGLLARTEGAYKKLLAAGGEPPRTGPEEPLAAPGARSQATTTWSESQPPRTGFRKAASPRQAAGRESEPGEAASSSGGLSEQSRSLLGTLLTSPGTAPSAALDNAQISVVEDVLVPALILCGLGFFLVLLFS